ncbi:CTLH/CRA C-terminal to lish motif domain-containing protein [Phlyctochytrium arcticum]|nr:CTLH/CRA C-terminal to lish motif domain-containing protein [Phlyctochytrium arcticum]
METLEAISADFAKVAQKQESSTAEVDSVLQSLIDAFTGSISQIEADPSSLSSTLALLKQKTGATAKTLSSQQEDVRRAAMRHDKTLRASFKTDLNNIWDPKAFEGKEDVLNKTIAMHLIREGKFALAESLIKEAKLDFPSELQGQFAEMYQILEVMRMGQLEPAIRWATTHREELVKRSSGLEFQLHRLQFLQFLSTGQTEAALQYAKANFSGFAGHQFKEIQRLMCAFLYANRLAESPYADLLDPRAWSDIQHHFTRDFCQLLGLSSESPLYVSVLVGTLALPTIIKMSSIMKDKSGLEWSQAGELPVEIPLLPSQHYHSVFACPVSKEQSTEENPPMMMGCGHVICKCCLDRLGKGSQNTRFKCPYCPTESTAAQANRIYI